MCAVAKKLTRRDRNKARHQQEILDAALEVFAEKGYQNASVQEIADRADFAVSTLYALFENKEDLYRQVSIDIGRRTGAMFETAMAEGANAHEQLVIYARTKGAVFRESPPGVWMLEHELHALRMDKNQSFPKNGIGRIYRRFMERIEALFAEGIEQGLFIQGDPGMMAKCLDAMTNTLMLQSLTDSEATGYDERVDEIIQMFFGPVLTPRAAKQRKDG